jgi:hypothetical protein
MDLPIDDDSKYFITEDAKYCHLLPDRIIITTQPVFQDLPQSIDRKNTKALILGGIGVVFGCFLMVNFFIVGFYLMGILFFLGMFFATKGLAEVARYSTILNIERKDIEALQVFQPRFAYIYVLIRFRNAEGKKSLRKIKLYDSLQNEQKAIRLLRDEGLLGIGAINAH